MAKNSTKAVVFAAWLRGQMAQAGLSQRELGKRIDPEQRERGRRQVVRHLSGQHFPNARTRRGYLEVFGLEGDPFTDDDPEDSPMASELAYLASRLKKLERRVAVGNQVKA